MKRRRPTDAPQPERPRTITLKKSVIVVDPKFNARQSADADEETRSEEDTSLRDSIDEVGPIQDPAVRQLEDGRYFLIAGFRRLSTYKDDDLVDCKLLNVDDLGAYIVNLAENIHRRGLKPHELAARLAMMAKKYRLTATALAERVGLSQARVANLIRLRTKLVPELWQLYRRYGDSLAPADDLLRICALPADEQIAAWRARHAEQKAEKKSKGKRPSRRRLELYRAALTGARERSEKPRAWCEGALHGIAVALGSEKPAIVMTAPRGAAKEDVVDDDDQ